ncbi:flavodoxin family protein [Falsiroseomonas sp. E2-1-a4]|uniref:flavodoxin family protein n=1 Tax=Falsiroseomonas sp. E2-1-a4 TaxID=3239299 RepID=UPI003F3C6652
MPLKAIALNCTLKSDASDASSTDAMLAVVKAAFVKQKVEVTETVRVAALNIKPGVTSDEGPGDDWPTLRAKILACDILIFGGPIWLGGPSSVARRVLERMDAFISETDDKGRMPSYGKVAVTAIVGNEDGAHACAAQIYQALADVGWTIPPSASCYWVGEAMGSVVFKDLDPVPEKTQQTAAMMAATAAHLAGLLQAAPYPGQPED